MDGWMGFVLGAIWLAEAETMTGWPRVQLGDRRSGSLYSQRQLGRREHPTLLYLLPLDSYSCYRNLRYCLSADFDRLLSEKGILL